VAGEEQIPDDLALSPAESLAAAQRLIDAGRPFQAHEVLEAAWKSAPDAERDLWQGLAQITVGLTHAQRGNATGAAALLRRGTGRVRGYVASGTLAPHGIDAARISVTADNLASRIERDGLATLSPSDLTPRLNPGASAT
jgi:hypothetical protein